MLTWILSIASIVLVSFISFVGVLTLWVNDRILRKILLYLVSFSAGSLMGDAFIHLIPEAAEGAGLTVQISLLILSGIFASFAIERFLQWRHCHIPTSREHPHSFAYMNFVGDGVHNLIDGLIIGGSYLVNVPLGVATTLAVIFHEVPQELGDFGVLIHGGFAKRKALWFNFLTALTAVVGTVLSLFLGLTVESYLPLIVPFAAGNFIYIAGSDLMPELRKDSPEPRKALLQMVCLGLGVMLMLMLVLFE